MNDLLTTTRRSHFYARLPYILISLLASLSLLVLIGWQFQIEPLKRIMPNWVAMNPCTAICFLLACISLVISARRSTLPRSLLLIAQANALFIALFGIINLIRCLGGPDLHVDQLLYDLEIGAATHVDVAIRSNRIAPNTALLLTLLGIALYISRFNDVTSRIVAKGIAVVACLVALVAVVGYLNGVSTLYRPTGLTPMAIHTALGFLLFAGSILTLDLQAGLASSAPSNDAPEDLLRTRKKINIGFGIALFVLAVIGVVSFASIQSFAAANRSAERFRYFLATLAELSGAMSDAETGERGYAITGEDVFLAPYHRALPEIHPRLAELHALAVDNPALQQNLAKLGPLIDRELQFLQRVIELRRSGGEQAAEVLVATTEGKSRMDAVRKTIADVRSNENAMQNSLAENVGYTNNVTTTIITVGIVLAITVVGLAGWIIRRDLTQKQAAAEDLRQARLDAEDANEAKSRFLANMSHEIRTPMAAIIGYADLVLDPTQSPSDRLDHINTIRRNGEHLLTLINDILDLSKIEAGKVQVERGICCPCNILSDVASLMRIRAAEKRIKLEIKNDGPIPAQISTDSVRLRQILINLVGNAIKFTNQGSVRLTMKLQEPQNAPPQLRFEIVDSGVGMTPEQIGRLFQPFVQADASTTRRFGGTGLGLTISKRLAEMLGGSIDVQSDFGNGSTFTLIIDPGSLHGVKRLRNCREALIGADAAHPPSEVSTLTGRILLVDDGDDNRRLLSVYLEKAGAQVTLAENGRIGADIALAALAKKQPFDVILMDMQMPELDGYGATALLRSKGYTAPIIALTANAMAEDCDKCLSIGCTDYLSKPVRRPHLLQTVARYLNPNASTTPTTPAASSGAGQSTPLTSSSVAPSVIRSDLTDESLRHFLVQYIAELPLRIADLQSALDKSDLETLATQIHNLKGTGGLYGLMPITDAATQIEHALKQKAPLPDITHQVHDLIQTLQRVEGFNHPASTSQPQ